MINLVPVIVMMLVNAKKRQVFRMLIDVVRMAVAADVAVNAEDEISLLHDEMKIVRDQ